MRSPATLSRVTVIHAMRRWSMDAEPWGNDDASWWHQLDLEMQGREEEERIDACNRALAELKEYNHE